MKNILLSILLFLCAADMSIAFAQNYDAPPVTISSDKIRMNGKLYYQHRVLDKQTLYSISKAYNVSMEEITEANPSIVDGQLKSGSIIMIPAFSATEKPEQAEINKTAEVRETKQLEKLEKPDKDVKSESETISQETPIPDKYDGIDYSIHIVKWYESLRSIAKKYGISEEILVEFNSLESTLLKKRQKIRIPDKEFIAELERMTGGSMTVQEHPVSKSEPTAAAEAANSDPELSELGELIAQNGRQTVKLALILPLDCTQDGSGGNVNYMDFYSGALLAAKRLSEAGMKMEIEVIDSEEYESHLAIAESGLLDDCNYVIGPIHRKNLAEILPYCLDKGIKVVSPLDPKAASLLTDFPNLFQAPASTATQFENIAEWIRTQRRSSPVIVISETAGNRGEELEIATNALQAKNIEYKVFSYNILQGRGVDVSISKLLDKSSKNHIIIASENEAFVNDAIRNLNTIATMFKYDISTYASSKVNHFETISADNFHNTDMHMAMGYYIDYDDKETMRFVSEYRALFNSEPSQFAFQGYDMVKYFAALSISDKIMVDDYQEKQMLQSNIEFRRVSGNETGTLGGYENSATRNIIFGSNYSIRIEK